MSTNRQHNIILLVETQKELDALEAKHEAELQGLRHRLQLAKGECSGAAYDTKVYYDGYVVTFGDEFDFQKIESVVHVSELPEIPDSE